MEKRINYKKRKGRKRRFLLQFVSLILTVVIIQMFLQYTLDTTLSVINNRGVIPARGTLIVSTSVLLILGSWLWALMGDVMLANVLLIFVGGIMGVVNLEKTRQRTEPLYPSDFEMITASKSLLGMVPWQTAAAGIAFVLFGGVVIYFLIRRNLRRQTPKLSKKNRLAMLLVTSIGVLYIGQFQQPGNLVKLAYEKKNDWILWSQLDNYHVNGFVAGFLYNLPSDPMEKPAYYSAGKIDELQAKYQVIADEINAGRDKTEPDVNIIFVMNESFSDPLELDGLNLGMDPIPFVRALADNSYSGEMLSTGYGGGTANIEFEALSTFSMEPFGANITTPYTQFLSSIEQFPSVVSRLKDAGYATTAIHPFNTTMYKRKENYKVLGFDSFIYDATMSSVTERIDTNPYISDKSAYEEVLQKMAETPETDFIHLVTMQNHAPYVNKYTAVPSYEESGIKDEEVRNYLQDLIYSDEAFELLMTQLADFEEPTVVVFWGDHQSSVFGESVYEENEVQNMHETPLRILSNFDSSYKDLGTISPIYFYTEVLEMTQTKLIPYDALLETLQSVLPAFEKSMYLNGQTGEYVFSREDLPEETLEILSDYEQIQYDVLTGKRFSMENDFFE